MSETQHASPEHAAEFLAANPDAVLAASSAQSVCLGPSNNGWFVLYWSASATGTYDWIGLYANDSDPDDKYVGGNNWQWATRGSSYTTSTAVQPGYQARYLIWDADSKAYKSVARTSAFPDRICS